MPRHERRLVEPHFQEQNAGRDRFNLFPNEIVHNYRVLRGWTQEVAAASWGVHVRTWRRWEQPTAVPKAALLTHIKQWARRSCPEYLHYVS